MSWTRAIQARRARIAAAEMAMREVGVVVSNLLDIDYARFVSERGRGRCLAPEIVHGRTIAAALMRDLFPGIGCIVIAKALGMSDHTSALHYLWRAERTSARATPEYLEAKSILAPESPRLSPVSPDFGSAMIVAGCAE